MHNDNDNDTLFEICMAARTVAFSYQLLATPMSNQLCSVYLVTFYIILITVERPIFEPNTTP